MDALAYTIAVTSGRRVCTLYVYLQFYEENLHLNEDFLHLNEGNAPSAWRGGIWQCRSNHR